MTESELEPQAQPESTPAPEPQPTPEPETKQAALTPPQPGDNAAAARHRKQVEALQKENERLKAEMAQKEKDAFDRAAVEHEITKMEVLADLQVPLTMRSLIRGNTREEIQAEVDAWRAAVAAPAGPALQPAAPQQQTAPPPAPPAITPPPPPRGESQEVRIEDLPPEQQKDAWKREYIKLAQQQSGG